MTERIVRKILSNKEGEMGSEMATDKYVQAAIPQFDGFYDHWAMRMENLLRSKEYWEMVETGIPSVDDGSVTTDVHKQLQLKDLRVKNYLFQAIDRTIMETILDKSSAKSIWDSMKQKYQGSSRVKRAQLQALRREFEVLQMREGEKVDEYFARTLTIVNKMKIHGEKIDQVMVIEKILRSLTSRFDYVVCSVEESNDLSALTIDELQSSLLVHEQRLNRHSYGDEQALNITYAGERGRGGRVVSRGRGRGRGRQGFNKTLVECFKCHKLGHYQYECPSWEKGAHFAEINPEEELLLMAQTDLVNPKETMWFLDSGCNNHMTGDKHWFIQLDESFRQVVKLGNDTKMAVMGKGNIKFRVNGTSQVISDVFYLPDLKNNLLSIGQLQEHNLGILIQNGECRIYHHERGLIMQTRMSANRMFILLAERVSLQQPVAACFKVTAESQTELWHRRYGHLHFKGLITLSRKSMVTGMPPLGESSTVCSTCMVGKQHRETIPKKSLWRATHQLQLIHADLCGPITPESHSHKRYILTFTDDYSRKLWTYLLNLKSETLAMFIKFRNLVEKESKHAIICLRTDRGGEFTSSAFSEYCSNNGIRRQLIAGYTPQQNGVAERKNRTLMNMVRCMLTEKQVPKEFWPEAVNWAVHLLNRCPTLAVKDKTPEEAWSGLTPSVEHFRVFGCLGHVHIPDQHRQKLDDKSRLCVFLGVSHESKAYRMYDPMSKKIVVSKDVVFEENNQWDWTGNAGCSTLEWGDDLADCDYEDDQVCEDELNCDHSVNRGDGLNVENNAHEQQQVDNTDTGLPLVAETHSPTQGRNLSINEEQDSPVQGRIRRAPSYFKDYVSGDDLSDSDELINLVLFTASNEPIFFEDAVRCSKWKEAMDLEIKSIEKNGTWELTTLPTGAKKIGVKWIFKTKLDENGKIAKLKARLVAKGFSQKFGVDYTEVFAPVARWDTIRMILALAAGRGWDVYQLDVKSAFLHGELTEAVFIEQPRGYEVNGEEDKVYRLKKALYGLKQAPRAWYNKLESYFIKEGFERCPSEYTLFTKTLEGKCIIVSVYVDDLIFTGNDAAMFDRFKNSMKLEFDMSDLGKMKYFLGVEVMQTSEGIFINQRKYANEVLERFGMINCNAVKNPMVPCFKAVKDEDGTCIDATIYKQMVGSLMYLTATRPDLAFVVSVISRFMEKPTELHQQMIKRVLRYVKGTIELGIFYKRGGEEKLTAYTDSDYAGDVEDRKSTSGYAFLISSGAVAWSSKKQPVVTLSTTEAEFIAAAACACQSIWMRKILATLGFEGNKCTDILCDNSSTIKLSKNPVIHGRSKHIDVRFHFLRDLTMEGTVKLEFCGSKHQLADIMTKPLTFETFARLRELLGVRSRPNIN